MINSEKAYFGEDHYVEYASLIWGCVDWLRQLFSKQTEQDLNDHVVWLGCTTRPEMLSSLHLQAIISELEATVGCMVKPESVSPSQPLSIFHLFASLQPILLIMGRLSLQEMKEFKNLY